MKTKKFNDFNKAIEAIYSSELTKEELFDTLYPFQVMYDDKSISYYNPYFRETQKKPIGIVITHKNNNMKRFVIHLYAFDYCLEMQKHEWETNKKAIRLQEAGWTIGNLLQWQEIIEQKKDGLFDLLIKLRGSCNYAHDMFHVSEEEDPRKAKYDQRCLFANLNYSAIDKDYFTPCRRILPILTLD